jgi:hypothetical protein
MSLKYNQMIVNSFESQHFFYFDESWVGYLNLIKIIKISEEFF